MYQPTTEIADLTVFHTEPWFNAVSMLNERQQTYTRDSSGTGAVFTDSAIYRSGGGFCVDCSFTVCFGSRHQKRLCGFSEKNKKQAKQNAAYAALRYLQNTGDQNIVFPPCSPRDSVAANPLFPAPQQLSSLYSSSQIRFVPERQVPTEMPIPIRPVPSGTTATPPPPPVAVATVSWPSVHTQSKFIGTMFPPEAQTANSYYATEPSEHVSSTVAPFITPPEIRQSQQPLSAQHYAGFATPTAPNLVPSFCSTTTGHTAMAALSPKISAKPAYLLAEKHRAVTSKHPVWKDWTQPLVTIQYPQPHVSPEFTVSVTYCTETSTGEILPQMVVCKGESKFGPEMKAHEAALYSIEHGIVYPLGDNMILTVAQTKYLIERRYITLRQ
jgi:hypothetical protein